jgi:hypothetical protein
MPKQDHSHPRSRRKGPWFGRQFSQSGPRKNKRPFNASFTNLMSKKFTAHIKKEDCISFFNLCASLPEHLRKTKFERQTQKKYTTIRADEIHNDTEVHRKQPWINHGRVREHLL